MVRTKDMQVLWELESLAEQGVAGGLEFTYGRVPTGFAQTVPQEQAPAPLPKTMPFAVIVYDRFVPGFSMGTGFLLSPEGTVEPCHSGWDTDQVDPGRKTPRRR